MDPPVPAPPAQPAAEAPKGDGKKEINMMEMKSTVQKLPLLTVQAGPRDGDAWVSRLKEEYGSLIAYQKMNKEAGNDWFTIESNKTGTKWTGKVWFVHNLLRYEFDLEFELPVTYPSVPPELALPEIDGKTEKMYRGGKICLDAHFRPLWARNVPHFGLAHAMALGMAPWLAAEVPHLVAAGRITHKDGGAKK
jgi:ufm1-conjugating enzyme 1